jgi:hypothetical protein
MTAVDPSAEGTACTEPHPAALDNGIAREGQKGMRKKAQHDRRGRPRTQRRRQRRRGTATAGGTG